MTAFGATHGLYADETIAAVWAARIVVFGAVGASAENQAPNQYDDDSQDSMYEFTQKAEEHKRAQKQDWSLSASPKHQVKRRNGDDRPQKTVAVAGWILLD
ncbi:MAG: hypothetical protein H6818_12825 [Phycisphaerales bacterium]|nr:hypothetical protein [Phycisphaerales bacterium]